MPRVVHFEIHAGDPDRAVNFYKTLFGWNFQKWEGPMEYWLVTTGSDDQPGINGGLYKQVLAPRLVPTEAEKAVTTVLKAPTISRFTSCAGRSSSSPR